MSHKRNRVKYRATDYGKYFIKEIIPVTAGILIALSIGNWNQNRKEQKYVKEIFSLIDNELDDTHKGIEEVIPLQESLMDTLQYYSNNKDVSILQTILKVGGIYIAPIKTNAWVTFSNSKLELIDYQLIAPLSDMVEQREILKSKSTTLTNFINSNLSQTEREKKEILILHMKDVIGTEKVIQQQIEEVKRLRAGRPHS
ncbi:MAG: hypothetical protein EAS48_03390 [Chryseobacterium sp.]|nr:MAG: hypothetical protein EAS48_03390 [Chryseobacterium sp.]